jgi:hypothetical protein
VTKPAVRTENQVSKSGVITLKLDLPGLEVVGQTEGTDGSLVVIVQYRHKIDMSNVYREVIELCLPGVQVVAERFHVVRRVGAALSQLRLRLQRREGQEREGELYEDRHVLLSDQGGWTRTASRLLRRLFNRFFELEIGRQLKESIR